MRVLILGCGKLGTNLERWLTGIGVVCSATAAPRAPLSSPLDADLVVIAVPDAVTSTVAHHLRGCLPTADLVHTAGAFGGDLLSPAGIEPSRTGVWHPLGSLSAGAAAPAHWTVTAPDRLTRILAGLTSSLGGRSYSISEDARAMYHAGAVFASNYVSTLLACARESLGVAGLPAAEAEEAACGLAASALAAAQRHGVDASLTGPLARGDFATVERHLASLPSELAQTYSALAEETARQFLPNKTSALQQLRSIRDRS